MLLMISALHMLLVFMLMSLVKTSLRIITKGMEGEWSPIFMMAFFKARLPAAVWENKTRLERALEIKPRILA